MRVLSKRAVCGRIFGVHSHSPGHRSHPLGSHAGVRSVRIAQPPEHLEEGGPASWSRVDKKKTERKKRGRGQGRLRGGPYEGSKGHTRPPWLCQGDDVVLLGTAWAPCSRDPRSLALLLTRGLVRPPCRRVVYTARSPDGAACAIHPPWNALGEDPADAADEPHGPIHDAEGGRRRPGGARSTPSASPWGSVSARARPDARARARIQVRIARRQVEAVRKVHFEGLRVSVAEALEGGPRWARVQYCPEVLVPAGTRHRRKYCRLLAGRKSRAKWRRESVLGSAVHHFACAEVIPCLSQRRWDVRRTCWGFGRFSFGITRSSPPTLSPGRFSSRCRCREGASGDRAESGAVIWGRNGEAVGISWDSIPFALIERPESRVVPGRCATSRRCWSHFYAVHAGRSGAPAGNWVTASLPLEFLLRSPPAGSWIVVDATGLGNVSTFWPWKIPIAS